MEELKKRFLELLEADMEFRYTVAGYLGLSEILKRLEDHDRKFNEILRELREQRKVLEEHDRRFNEILVELRRHADILEEHGRVLREHDRRFNEILAELRRHADILEEHGRLLERHADILEEHSKRLEELSRGLQALGARWGILAEDAFRNAMKGIVEKYYEGKVSRWEYYDSEGIVYGYPSIIEIDLVITDKEHIIVEIKSSIHRGDIAELDRIAKLYRKVTGVKPRLAVISPYIDADAKELAEKLGIETYTSLA